MPSSASGTVDYCQKWMENPVLSGQPLAARRSTSKIAFEGESFLILRITQRQKLVMGYRTIPQVLVEERKLGLHTSQSRIKTCVVAALVFASILIFLVCTK